ncbi:MAG: GTP-binding protein [Candidatus Harrisonbacteria bacterium]|nr:GTP-binding protein [Candidatus Harrisonbacteria bacterium]
MKRPPVIVVVGHVDHGKTTLLDYIRKANVASREVGGITQSVGAYEITHARTNAPAWPVGRDSNADARGEKITFIDTPGHEAFSKMRKRGAHIADLAILVVAATDGVQQQTKEAIKILKETETPFVVAINKIDAAGADEARVKNELMQEQVFLEGSGGDVSWHAISAKTGQGVGELLDLLLLAADVEDLTYDPEVMASGFVLEAKRDAKKGIIATVIVKDGTLRVGDVIHAGLRHDEAGSGHAEAGGASGKIKALENFLGERVKELLPSAPARVSGFEVLPGIGTEFHAGATLPAQEAAVVKVPERQMQKKLEENEAELNLILKADVSGSLEALSGIMRNLPHPAELRLTIIDESVGDVTDGDVKDAIGHHAIIIGFRTRATKAAEELARVQRIEMIQSEIVYDLVKAVEERLKSTIQTKAAGILEVLAMFGKKGKAQIVGGKVTEGEIKNNAELEISRRDAIVGKGKIVNLQQNRVDAPVVSAGKECGILFDSEVEVKVGDHLIMR